MEPPQTVCGGWHRLGAALQRFTCRVRSPRPSWVPFDPRLMTLFVCRDVHLLSSRHAPSVLDDHPQVHQTKLPSQRRCCRAVNACQGRDTTGTGRTAWSEET
jgi:hypothetical protein